MESSEVRPNQLRLKPWRPARNDLLLGALVLALCLLDALVSLTVEVTGSPISFDWTPRFGQLFIGALLCLVPGALLARLVSRGYPASLRDCAQVVMAFVAGSALGHWPMLLLIPASPTREVLDLVRLAATSLLLYSLAAVWIVGAMYWWRQDTTVREALHRTHVGLLALKADRDEAELLRLRTQIEPHFLFNTIATIGQLYQTDRAIADHTLARLIEYMSASRSHMRRQEAAFEEELSLAEGYLEIQRLRMGARLHYTIDVPLELRGNRIPPAALLTLIENAIKHGLAPRADRGALTVTADRHDPWVVVTVLDNGVGFRQTTGRGLGLANLRARLQGLYGDGAWLRLTSPQQGGVMATMRLPLGPPLMVGPAG